MNRAEEIKLRLDADAANGELDSFCANLGIDLLVLFGSAAVDITTAHDVDLAYSVDFTAPRAKRPHLLDVAAAFHARYGEGVDLMDLDHAGTVAQYEAMRKGKLLAGANPDKYAVIQMAAAGKYIDEIPRRRFELESLAGR